MVSIRLTNPQRQTLQRALEERYLNEASMEDMLLRIDKKFHLIAGSGLSFQENLAAVIRRAETEDWLLALVTQMRRDTPADHGLERLQDELIPLGPPPEVDYFEVCRLAGRRVMIDRAELRTTLRSLSQPLGSRIMVVTGRNGSGKSHSLQLMSYLNEVRGGFSLIPIDLGAYRRVLRTNATIKPSDIADSLVKKLGYDFKPADPATDKQWARWVLDFCEDFEAHALRDAGFRWVVIDGFGRVRLQQYTLDLIKELAIRIDRSLARFRLILLGYDGAFPPEVGSAVERERIEPIGERELALFFGLAYQQLAIPFDEGKLEDSVFRVLKGLDASQEDFLLKLEPRVCDELARAAGP